MIKKVGIVSDFFSCKRKKRTCAFCCYLIDLEKSKKWKLEEELLKFE